MHALKAGFVALAFASVLGGCSPTAGAPAAFNTDIKAVEAQVAKLVTEPVKGKATAAADVASVRDALPKEVTLTWGNLTFDTASGATVLTDVKLTPTNMPAIGVGIAELRLIDFDAVFAKARLTGQRLAEAAPLARRIDAKGVSVFGLADMANQITSAMGVSNITIAPSAPVAVAPGATPAPPAQNGEPGMTIKVSGHVDRYDVSIARMVFDNVALRAFELPATPASAATAPPSTAPGSEPGMPPIIMQMVSAYHSLSIDTFGGTDLKLDMAMTEAGQKVAMAMTAATMGGSGMRGLDYDVSYVRNMSMQMNMSGSEPGAAVQMPAIPAIKVGWGLYSIHDMKLDKVASYLAKGVIPPRTEANLLSLGVFHTEKESWSINGQDIYSVGDSTIDARGFRWFIPTDITATGHNISINVAALAKFAQSAVGSMSAMPADPDNPLSAMPPVDMTKVIAAIDKYGLSTVNMNYNAGWKWNADTGDAKIDYAWSGDKLLKISGTYEGGFPSFQAVSDLIPNNVEATNGDAVANLFTSKSTLKLVNFDIVDDGGLDKIFGLAGELAPMPGPGAATGGAPGATSAQTLRTVAVAGLRFLSASAGSQMPQLPAMIDPVAAFLEMGGKLHIEMKPKAPVPLVGLGGTDGQDPTAVLSELGLKVEQSGGKK